MLSDKNTDEKKRESLKWLTTAVGEKLSFLSPNTWTVLSFAMVFIAAGFFIKGNLALGLVSMVAFVLADGVDGAVAKYRNEKTRFGALLDHSVDKLGEGILLVSIGFAALPLWGMSAFFYAGIAAWASILISAIDAKGGEAWGNRVKRKLYGRVERMGMLIAMIGLAIPLGNAFISPALVVFTAVSLITCFHLLWHYAKR